MDSSSGVFNCPRLTITYREWKEQQKRWLPNYDVITPSVPVRKVKSKKKATSQWSHATHMCEEVEETCRKKQKATGQYVVECSKSTRSPKTLQVFIKSPLNTRWCLRLDDRTLVKTVRKRVAKQLGIDAAKLRLTMKTYQLCDALSLYENGVTNESNIAVIVIFADGLRGGAGDSSEISDERNSKCNRLSEKELLAVASEVTDIYEQLTLRLGFSKADIVKLRGNHSGSGIQQVVFVTLVKWQQAQSSSTDFRKTLADALRHCKRIDLVEKVLKETLLDEETLTGGEDKLDVNQCQEDLRWRYLNSICQLPKYPWDESDCININDIYTDLSLLVDSPSPCQPMKIPLKTQDEVFTHKTVAEISSTRVIIQGEAGTGKSTLMVKYAYDWARPDTTSSPVRKYKLLFLLRMRDLEESTNLEDAILNHLLPHDTKITSPQLKAFLQDHPEDCCVILDGYDEFRHSGIATSSGSIVQMIHNNVMIKCFLILSSRPEQLPHLSTSLRQYRQFEVSGFSKDKIQEYIKKFFGKQTDLAENLVDFIESNNLDPDFAAAPLVTQLLCLYWMKLEESEGPKTPDYLTSICKLHDALFDFLEEHYIAKHADESDIHLEEIVLDLGKVALKSLWPPNSQLVFTCSDFLKDVSEEVANKACAVGILRKQEITHSIRCKGGRRSSLSSWKKSSTVEFFHKSAQEKCAAKYLTHLAETEESAFTSMMEALTLPSNALSVKMILIFACGSSVRAAKMIVRHLADIFNNSFQQDLDEYLTGSLHYERSKIMQDMIDLCLTCNFECGAEGKLNDDLLSIFKGGRILHTGITPQRTSNLAYLFSNLTVSDAVKTVSIFGVPSEGTFFIPTETKESTSDRTFHDYLEIYSKLSNEQQQDKLEEFALKCEQAKAVSEQHGIPCTLASMHMWQLFGEWQKETQSAMTTLISSLKYVTLQSLILRSITLGESSEILWKIIADKHLQNLTSLNLRQTGLTAADVRNFAKCVRCLTKLEVLDICQNEKAGDSLGILCSRLSLIKLKSLDAYRMLASPGVMREVHIHLPGLGTQLTELQLHVNSMDEEGAERLAESITKLPQLTLLTLPSPRLHGSPAAMHRLFKNITDLQHLHNVIICSGNIQLELFLNVLIPELKKWHNIQVLRLRALECAEINVCQGEQFLEAISCLNCLHTLKLDRIGLINQHFDELVRHGRRKKFKSLWYSRNVLPDGFSIPDDEFVTII